jgi:hypothetical protein
MRHNLEGSKVIQYLGTILLASILLLSSVAATPPTAVYSKSVSEAAISRHIVAQSNPQLSDDEKIKAAIDAYFTTRYEGQKLLATQDFSSLLEDNTLAWVQKEKDKREIELYLASLFDLKYVSYNYTLDYDSIKIKNNKATVQLRESHTVVFEALAPNDSELFNLQHVFTLHNKKGQWVIYKDEYQDELSEEMTQLSKAEIEKIVDQNYIEDLNRLSQESDITSPAVITPSLTTHAYSAAQANAYADAHVTSTCYPNYGCNYNTAYYKTEPNNDCANFVSQALYAGEGKSPPDTSGMAGSGRGYYTDWYYVFNNPPGTQNGSGSSPWIQVRPQYDFIRLNSSHVGPYGIVTGFASVTAGDPVYISQSSSFDHEGIIISKGSTLSGTTIDAHTNDRRHYPLSNWATYSPVYIHIQGWQN